MKQRTDLIFHKIALMVFLASLAMPALTTPKCEMLGLTCNETLFGYRLLLSSFLVWAWSPFLIFIPLMNLYILTLGYTLANKDQVRLLPRLLLIAVTFVFATDWRLGGREFGFLYSSILGFPQFHFGYWFWLLSIILPVGDYLFPEAHHVPKNKSQLKS